MQTTHLTSIARSGSAGSPASGPSGGLTAVALALAGFLFVLYPALRPFSDETSLQGAAAFASPAWLVSHALAMAAFVLLPLGMLGLSSHLRDTHVGKGSLRAALLSWVGAGLTLPYYGAETFGLAAIGQEALDRADAGLIALADAIRFGPGGAPFVLGLVLLATGSIVMATAVWRSGRFPTWTGIPLAVGLVLYLPQFATPQPVRILHGAVMAIGCVLLARSLAVQRRHGEDAGRTVGGPPWPARRTVRSPVRSTSAWTRSTSG